MGRGRQKFRRGKTGGAEPAVIVSESLVSVIYRVRPNPPPEALDHFRAGITQPLPGRRERPFEHLPLALQFGACFGQGVFLQLDIVPEPALDLLHLVPEADLKGIEVRESIATEHPGRLEEKARYSKIRGAAVGLFYAVPRAACFASRASTCAKGWHSSLIPHANCASTSVGPTEHLSSDGSQPWGRLGPPGCRRSLASLNLYPSRGNSAL